MVGEGERQKPKRIDEGDEYRKVHSANHSHARTEVLHRECRHASQSLCVAVKGVWWEEQPSQIQAVKGEGMNGRVYHATHEESVRGIQEQNKNIRCVMSQKEKVMLEPRNGRYGRERVVGKAVGIVWHNTGVKSL